MGKGVEEEEEGVMMARATSGREEEEVERWVLRAEGIEREVCREGRGFGWTQKGLFYQ